MTVTLRFFSSLALALWLGGLVFFSAVVAPTAFSVLPSHVLAGDVVGGTLGALNDLGDGCAVVLLLAFLARGLRGEARRGLFLKGLLAAVALGLSLGLSVVIMPPMAALRAQAHGIENLPVSDPRRVEFERWHHLSVDVMSLEILGVLAVLVLEQIPDRPKPAKP